MPRNPTPEEILQDKELREESRLRRADALELARRASEAYALIKLYEDSQDTSHLAMTIEELAGAEKLARAVLEASWVFE